MSCSQRLQAPVPFVVRTSGQLMHTRLCLLVFVGGQIAFPSQETRFLQAQVAEPTGSLHPKSCSSALNNPPKRWLILVGTLKLAYGTSKLADQWHSIAQSDNKER